ncbi:MAG: DEAD/DEAH box helicase [Acidobacteria bacterium]|nr:MAG: DEAD/DEAH box helicase [Acidobacteriota bacterium]
MASMQPPAAEVVAQLREDRRLGPLIVDSLYLPAVPVCTGALDPPLPLPLRQALVGAGTEHLWSHQVEGLAAVRAGRDVLVTTPTASGKSLVFHLPVLEEAHAEDPGRALFLYPLKALGQDQKAKFDALAEAAGLAEQARCEIYDGDTPKHLRQKIKKDPPRVLVTNPDMLHLGLLSYWQSWEPFLRDLRWVVLDELHTYRGIFGSHFHHVLQRLLRLCNSVGSQPVFIASSATAANADEFGEILVGRPFTWVNESGAPREGRHFLLIRPEASPYTTALHLLIELLEAGLKTIVFTKARRITELLYSWLRQQSPEKARRVASYRSGFLPEERRDIERRLFEGELDGVISTSALEMGIDVGGLDACVLVGFPGSVMATWQRSGRVGRAERESITAMVALPDALDHYLLEHPNELIERPYERLIVDPSNEPVSKAHLVCAAAEMPLDRRNDASYLERHAVQVGELLRESELTESADGRELYSRRRRPQRKVSLRGSSDTATILDARSGTVIGTVDGVRVRHECHPGAVYLHAGRQFLVEELDLEADKVHAKPVKLDYFTTPLTEKETEILEVLRERQEGALQSWLGRLLVTERVVGFERKRIQGQEVIDQQPLELPPVQFETVGLWWVAPKEIEMSLKGRDEHFMGALHAAEHAAISLFPLLAICDRGDIGGISIPMHPQVRSGCVFIYDGHAGGVGIAARGFDQLPELLLRVLDLVESCDCEEGCPSCIQSPKCGNGNRPLDKKGAARLIRLLLGYEQPLISLAEQKPVIVSLTPEEPQRPASVPTEKPASPQAVDGPASDPAEETESRPVSKRQAPVPDAASGRDRVTEPKLPTDPHNTVLFDLETQLSAADVGGWQNAHRMLVAIGVVCHLEEGRLEVFHEDEVEDLVRRLEAADLVVGFNVKRFDYKVLSGYTGVDYRRTLPTMDLLEVVHRQLGFRLGLNHLAQATLEVEKSADGLQSLEWVKQGRLDLVEEYCRRDVEILRDLYLFGRRMGYVLYRDKQDRKIKLPIEW